MHFLLSCQFIFKKKISHITNHNYCCKFDDNSQFIYLFGPFIIFWKIIFSQNIFHINSISIYRSNSFQLSSSSCHAISIDIPDPHSPLFPIVHCFRQVLMATSRIVTELLYVVLPLHAHVKGYIGVHHLWARPYFSSNVPHVWFV